MGFWAMFLPTFIAFFSAIALFFGARHVTRFLEKRRLEKYLINEFELNELILSNLLRELEHLAYLSFRNIARNDKPVVPPVYSSYKRFFTESYFNNGFLYDKLKPIDINKLDRIMNVMNIEHQNYVRDKILEWHTTDGGVDGDKHFREAIEKEISVVSSFIKDIRDVREKLQRRIKPFVAPR
jgi:hypothetical protein